MHRGLEVAANRDILAGYRFCATMQLRTPLRVLQRHGTLHQGIDNLPERVTGEGWEGIWIPVSHSFRELGIDLDEPRFSMASDVGPIPGDGGDYLKFLIEARGAAEKPGSVVERRNAVGQVADEARWRPFVDALGGRDAVLDRLFPPFLSTIPRLAAKTAAGLAEAGFATPRALMRADDQALRSLTGVGPGTVTALRTAAREAPDPDSRYVDRVIR